MHRIWQKNLGIAVLSIFLVLAGCSSQSTSKPAKKYDNVLNKGNGAEPTSLDPQKVEDYPSAHIVEDLFEGLVAYAPDSSGPDHGIIPGVAQSWEISPDQKTYTFHLRNDAKWSNGAPVTADDFVYGIRHGIDPTTAAGESYLLYPIQNAEAINAGKAPIDSLGVKALDKNTLQITLKAPTPYFLQIAAHPITYPAYKPSIDKWGNTATQPGHLVSNGAYELKEWVVNDHITLVRNPHYWDNAHTSIDAVNYYPTVDTNTELKMYEAGQLDYTYTVPSDSFKEAKQKYPTELHVSPWAYGWYLEFNTKKQPFNNVKLRQALSMAIDRDAITKDVLGNGSLSLYSLAPQGMVGTDANQNAAWSKWPRDKQIAEAQKLYHEAGYSKEHPLKATLLYTTNDDRKKTVTAIQAMWHDVLGADVTLENEEWKVWASDTQRGNYEINLYSWGADYNDISAYLTLLTCNSSQNSTGYCDPHYDQLVNAASNDAASQLVSDAFVLAPILQGDTAHLVKNYVGNYQQKQIQDYLYSKNWNLKQG